MGHGPSRVSQAPAERARRARDKPSEPAPSFKANQMLAADLKMEGNRLYSKGKYNAAIDAHYLLGLSLRELGNLEAGIKHLSKALELAREKDDAFKDEIWRHIGRARLAGWQQEAATRGAERDQLRARLGGLLAAAQREEAAAAPEGSQGRVRRRHEAEAAAFECLLERDAAADAARPAAGQHVCALTMEVFREPVVTPCGLSYERGALAEHLAKVGKFDPIPRAPLKPSDVRANLGLRAATELYLEEHPWAWEDVA